MKIAFVNDTFLEGRGVDTVIYEVARRLGKRHEVFVISSKSDFPEDNFKKIDIPGKKLLTGNTLKDSFSYFPNISKFKRGISKLNNQYGFEIINVHHSSLNPATGNLQTIVTWNGNPLSKNRIRNFFNRILLGRLRRNKVSVTISNYLKEKLSESAPRENIRVVYCGVSEEFKPTYEDKEYILFVGRFEEHKRIQELILLSKKLDYPVYLVGTGPLEERLKSYAKKIGANKVVFTGRVDRKELIGLYQNCSFFVSGSKWEGFGLIFLEAAACAKPSIGYSKGSIPEVIKEGETGYLVNSFESLKEKAEILIRDKKLRKSMGKEALKFSKGFSWDNCVEKYENIFMEVKNGS